MCVYIYLWSRSLPRVNSSCVTAPGPFPPSLWRGVGRGFAWISNILVDLAAESKAQMVVRGVWDICRVPEGWSVTWSVTLAGMLDERYKQRSFGGSIPRDPCGAWCTETLQSPSLSSSPLRLFWFSCCSIKPSEICDGYTGTCVELRSHLGGAAAQAAAWRG